MPVDPTCRAIVKALLVALALSFAAPAIAAPCNGNNCGTGAQAGKPAKKFMQRGPARRALTKIVKLGAPS